MDSEADNEDNEDDEDALTYATDQSYRTLPQEETSILCPIEVRQPSRGTDTPYVSK